MRISLVILTLNEILGLREVFDKIPLNAVDEVFAVDGGSSDGTAEFLKLKGIAVHPQDTRGRGAAFEVALRVSSGDAIIFFSPDGNEDPADIPKFRPLLEKGADLVIANRMSHGGHNEEDEQTFRIRKWANQIFTLIANLTWNRGTYIADTINGYRAITKRAWHLISPDGPGFTIEYQMSIRAMKIGLTVLEFPTWEASRVDSGRGSPGIATGLAFIGIYLRELRKSLLKKKT